MSRKKQGAAAKDASLSIIIPFSSLISRLHRYIYWSQRYEQPNFTLYITPRASIDRAHIFLLSVTLWIVSSTGVVVATARGPRGGTTTHHTPSPYDNVSSSFRRNIYVVGRDVDG
jgi:hypothetical protein